MLNLPAWTIMSRLARARNVLQKNRLGERLSHGPDFGLF
jgi:hypothetical protein